MNNNNIVIICDICKCKYVTQERYLTFGLKVCPKCLKLQKTEVHFGADQDKMRKK